MPIVNVKMANDYDDKHNNYVIWFGCADSIAELCVCLTVIVAIRMELVLSLQDK